tara:strand:+ start:15794 stop:17158 length:1365 start_codon:yes stop_codon:yes gene_type:complete
MQFKKFEAFINEELKINESTLYLNNPDEIDTEDKRTINYLNKRNIKIEDVEKKSTKDRKGGAEVKLTGKRKDLEDLAEWLDDSGLKLYIGESKIDVALNKMDKWLPEDPEAMERYYEIINQESWKDMKEFFIEYGNEDVLQSYGLNSNDMNKLAKAAMESYTIKLDEGAVKDLMKMIDDGEADEDILKAFPKLSQEELVAWQDSFINDIVADKIPDSVVEANLNEMASKSEVTKAFSEISKLSVAMLLNIEKFKAAKDKGDEKAIAKHRKLAMDMQTKKKKMEAELETMITGLDKEVELAIDEARVNEALARGLKPLLKLGSKVGFNTMSEEALLDLSDKFDELDDEQADDVASYLNMAIELRQDGYKGDATAKLKQFNKVCKDVLSGREVGSAFESTLNEEYIELMQIDEPLNGLKDAWMNWRQGPATNYEDVSPAYKELEKYVAKWMKKNLR